MNTWKEEAYHLLLALGGHAYLKDIYEEFMLNGTKEKVVSHQACLRDALEKGCIESVKYDGNIPLFYMVEGKNGGHYGIINYEADEFEYTQEDDEFSEGKILLKKHLRRERNQYVISQAKKQFKNIHGCLYCEIRGFDFNKIYGELGENYIEAHHTKPVSEMKENEKTNISDIVMVCSNCHSMLHRKKPWISKKGMKNILLK